MVSPYIELDYPITVKDLGNSDKLNYNMSEFMKAELDIIKDYLIKKTVYQVFITI
jgi:hypothetical protein